MLKGLIPCLKCGLEDMRANLDLMKFDLEGMIPIWDDIDGQTAAICRLQEDVLEMELIIEALEKGLAAYLVYQICRVLQRLRQWARTQSFLTQIRFCIWRLRLHIWATNIRAETPKIRIAIVKFHLWNGNRKEKLQ